MLRPRLAAADPGDRGRGGLARRPRSSRPPTGTASPPSPRTPDEPSATGIVVLPDVRGLYRFYEELALRFAERGLRGGRDRLLRPHGRGREARRRLPVHGARRADDARGHPGRRRRRRSPTCASEGATSVFTVGFCFGGRNSWLSAAGGHGLAGAVGFYGIAGRAERPAGPDAARRRDRRRRSSRSRRATTRTSPPSTTQAFDAALTAAGVEHEVVTYAGRAAQLLRPQVRRVRGRLGGRLEPRPRVRRRATAEQLLGLEGVQDEQSARVLKLLVASTSRPRAASACRSSPPPWCRAAVGSGGFSSGSVLRERLGELLREVVLLEVEERRLRLSRPAAA